MKTDFESRGFRRLLFLLALLSSAGYAARTLHRQPGTSTAGDEHTNPAPPVDERPDIALRSGGRPASTARRAAVAVAFAALFFSGAALTAAAGDEVGKLLDDTVETTTVTGETTTEDPPTAPTAAPAEPPPAAEPAPEPPAGTVEQEPVPMTDEEPSISRAPRVATTSANVGNEPAPEAGVAVRRVKKKSRPRVTAKEEAALHGGAAVIWLSRPLPDPTPPARRLDRWFVYDLLRASRRSDVDWALVLGVVRARGHGGPMPVNYWQLAALAARLQAAGAARNEKTAMAAVMGRADLGERALALARYNRAIGTETLVRGLAARKAVLIDRLLKDERAEIYAAGRDDLAAGRIDVRVVALISYLAESFGQVTVTSLFSGHRLYARPGVVSAHVYGHAVDVAALDRVSITGNQEPGGLTEKAVRSILLLPAELQPRQVISLLGFGGASFPLADHNDHIHVGY